MKQIIETKLGVIIIVIFAVTVGAFVWRYEKNQPSIEQSQMTYGSKKISTNITLDNKVANSNLPQEEEFPIVTMQPGVSLEDVIKQALYKKAPDWKTKKYSVTATVETNKEDHAIGRFTYDNNQTQYHNSAEGIWFAAKSDNDWTLVNISYVGYWGTCQDFKKYNFPPDMTPDCWDAEKNILVDTSNPQRFYQNGFIKADKNELIKAYISYQKENSGQPEFYSNKALYVRVDKNIKNYIKGTILFGGIENHSNPYFLAVKLNNEWKVVLVSQDIPLCNVIEPYKFPSGIVDKCYDTESKIERGIL